MFCSNCGKQNKKGAKFCSSCGASLAVVAEKENRRKPAEVEIKITQSNEKPKPKPNGCCMAILVLFIISIFIPMIAYISNGDTANLSSWIGLLVAIGSLALVIWLGILIIKWLVKLGLKKPIALLVVVGVAVLLFIPAYLSYQSYIYDELSQRVFFLEDKVTEISAAKMLGDTIMKQGAIPVGGVTLQNINDAAAAEKTRVGEASYTTELAGYKGVVTAWADKIATAKDYTSWNALADSPEKFEIIIPDSSLNKIFKQTVYDIAAVKEAGDWAIKKQDRTAMRFVAARLVAIDHLLASIESYQSVASNSLIAPAYADYVTGSGAVMRTRKLCFMNGKATTCLPEAREAVKTAKAVATKLYVFTPTGSYTAEPDPNISETGWDNSFDGLNLPPPAIPLGGAGITQGEPNVGPQLSPREIAFRNSCRSRGGNPDPTSITKTRLPTTESGYDCQLPNGCWEFTTAVSGRNYAGGNPGCPEEGLVPRVPPLEDLVDSIDNSLNDLNNNTDGGNDGGGTTPVVTSYDGTYTLTITSGGCNIPGIGYQTLAPTASQVTVRSNAVSVPNMGTVKINSSGYASVTTNISESGVVGRVTQTFQFSNNGTVASVVTAQASMSGVSVSCTVNQSGRR